MSQTSNRYGRKILALQHKITHPVVHVVMSDGEVIGVLSNKHAAYRQVAFLESEGHKCKILEKTLDWID